MLRRFHSRGRKHGFRTLAMWTGDICFELADVLKFFLWRLLAEYGLFFATDVVEKN